MKKTYSIIFTIIFFTVLVSGFTPVGAVSNVIEDFSDSPSPKATKVATASGVLQPSNQSDSKNNIDPSKTVIYKGEISATPSAIGKLLIKTDSGEKNVDTDKKTKVFSYDSGKRAISSVSKIKFQDKAVIVGSLTSDNKSLLATYILINNKGPISNRSAMYGIVSSREASGSAAFTIQVKSPNKDETKDLFLNSSTVIKVKDIESPKLSDIKIGDRVTLTFYTQNNINYVTRIFSIPGRAAGLLRDIRESSAASSAKPSASVSTTPIATTAAAVKSPTPAPTTKASSTPKSPSTTTNQ